MHWNIIRFFGENVKKFRDKEYRPHESPSAVPDWWTAFYVQIKFKTSTL